MSAIEEAVRHAGRILKEGYHASRAYTEKERGHLRSEYDLKSNTYLVGEISRIYPNDTVFSEEAETEFGNSSTRWLVDPMDGSAYFIFGEPYFSVSVARETGGRVVEAHVYNPMTDEYYYTDESIGMSYLNGATIHVSQIANLAESLVAFGFSANMHAIRRYYDEWRPVFEGCRKGIAWICPALSICNVARGRLEAFIDFGSSTEGQAAASLILPNAGGSAMNYPSGEYDHHAKGGVFTNGQIDLRRAAGGAAP